MRLDGDRLTRSELKAAWQRREGETVEDRSALQSLRTRGPPGPEDVVHWSVQEVLIMEQGHRIWKQPPPSPSFVTSPEEGIARLMEKVKALPRPPRVLENLILAALESLAKEGNARFLSFLEGRLRPLLQDLERVAKEALPQLGIPPEVSAAEEGTAEWFADQDLYACLRGRTKGEGPASTAGDYVLRAEGKGYDRMTVMEALRGFRDRGHLEHFAWPAWEGTRLKLVAKASWRAGSIVFDTLHPTARLFHWLFSPKALPSGRDSEGPIMGEGDG